MKVFMFMRRERDLWNALPVTGIELNFGNIKVDV